MTPYELPTMGNSRDTLRRMRIARRAGLAIAWFFIAMGANGLVFTIAYVVVQMLGRFA